MTVRWSTINIRENPNVTPSTEGFPYRNEVRSVWEQTKYFVQAQPSIVNARLNPVIETSRGVLEISHFVVSGVMAGGASSNVLSRKVSRASLKGFR